MLNTLIEQELSIGKFEDTCSKENDKSEGKDFDQPDEDPENIGCSVVVYLIISDKVGIIDQKGFRRNQVDSIHRKC